MKNYASRAVALYGLALALACFLNLDKLLPWYEHETLDMGSPVLQGLRAADTLRADLGVAAAVDAFDCSAAFLFNETYKDNSKCFDFGAAVGQREQLARLWAALTPRQQEQAALELYRRLGGGIRQVEFAPAAPEAPVAGPALAVISTGGDKTGLSLGLPLGSEGGGPETAPATPEKLPLKSVLVLGDSLALGLATPIERALKQYNEQISFAQVGKVSSGLVIPHLFDWEKKVQVLIEQHQPDLIIVMMGINDANNNIRMADSRAILGTPAWPVAYQERVERFIAIIAEKNVPTYWVGLPVVRDEAMTGRIEIANSAAEKACAGFELCRFIETKKLLTDDNGNYTNYKKDPQGYSIRIRAQDGIHFSNEGGDLLSRYILDYISKYVQLSPAAGVEKSI